MKIRKELGKENEEESLKVNIDFLLVLPSQFNVSALLPSSGS